MILPDTTAGNSPVPNASNARSRPFVVVSIVNWNTPAQTIACVESLRGTTWSRHRIVVIDNGSRDDSVARIRRACPHVTVLRAEENHGFAAGHLLGLRQAQAWDADAIWLLNSDARVEPDALAELAAAFEQHGNAIYGGVPLARRDDGRVMFNFPAKYLDPDGAPRAFDRDVELEFDAAWRARAPHRVGAVSGSTMLLPLALVAAHGWMDAAWFMQCEEIDYCYSLRSSGVPCFLVPRSRIWHEGEGSALGRPRVRDMTHYYHARNEIGLAQRHAGTATALLVGLKKLARAIAMTPANPRRARYILAGAWDGLRRVRGRRYLPDDGL